MFAEDMELLPDEPFHVAIEQIGLADPNEFGAAIEELWRAMDEGHRFGLRSVRQSRSGAVSALAPGHVFWA